MATLLSDAFTRADSAVSPGSPDVGGPYTVRAGTAGISSNQLYFPTISGTGLGSHLTFPAASDVDISLTLQAAANGNTVGAIARWQDASNNWLFRSNNAGIYITRCQAGALTNFASTTAVIPGIGDVMRFVAFGKQLYGYINGVLHLTCEDTRYNATYTPAGVLLNSTAHRVDDLLAVDATMPELAAELFEEVAFGDSLTKTASFLYKGRDTKALDEGNEA